MIKNIDSKLKITSLICNCFEKYFSDCNIYAIEDIPGEEHIFVESKGKPIFDGMVSTSRKFVFIWYYQSPINGIEMIKEMHKLCIEDGIDIVLKFPNVPTRKSSNVNSKVSNKHLYPTIVRFGKKPAGSKFEEFIIKAGNPDLEEKTYTKEMLEDFRRHNWKDIPDALNLILDRSKEMIDEKLSKNTEFKKNILGYYLYAGCAFSYAFPELSFGMRDIDVEVIFSKEKYTNTRCAYTRYCNIDKFGKPAYFNGETRWLDMMVNSLHSQTGNTDLDVVNYLNEMRHNSDRWATMSQRPFINLESKKIIYVPNWIRKYHQNKE